MGCIPSWFRSFNRKKLIRKKIYKKLAGPLKSFFFWFLLVPLLKKYLMFLGIRDQP
jgi:hypothetical protein